MANILIVFYSMYGHMYEMVKAAEEGAKSIKGTKVKVCRVPETLPGTVLEKMGATDFSKKIKDVPVCTVDDLPKYDGIIFATPTRFGNMAGQMRQFLDATGKLWMAGSLIGKPAAVMSSSATQHGGQESTILSTHITLLHQGMVIVGLPYSFQGQMKIDEMTGGSPYGASTITGGQGERMPSKNELEGARFQAAHLARIADKLKA